MSTEPVDVGRRAAIRKIVQALAYYQTAFGLSDGQMEQVLEAWRRTKHYQHLAVADRTVIDDLITKGDLGGAYEAGASIRTLAVKLGCSDFKVRRLLDSAGVRRRQPGTHKR